MLVDGGRETFGLLRRQHLQPFAERRSQLIEHVQSSATALAAGLIGAVGQLL
ncbi:MAG: hypothetical protein QM775_18140 [Pirellulales bacterium]